MSAQPPAPGFDAAKYQRPNQRWICGRACVGEPCRLGPSRWGNCRASAECSPVLEKKPGEAKGRWKCMRPGGACEQGPLPDGSCCRPVARCAPVRSLRAQRGLFTWAVLAATAGTLLVLLGGGWRDRFINPGGLSDAHASAAFAALAQVTNHSNQACTACHASGGLGPAGLVRAAFTASPGPFEWARLPAYARTEMTTIDQACARCHERHSFHAPNVVRDHSCSLCHQEHLGSGRMRAPAAANCVSCHGSDDVMAASALKAEALSPNAFAAKPTQGVKVFSTPRPAGGYTRVFANFLEHPEFRVHTGGLRDPNTLRFGHTLHLAAATIPKLPGGQKIDCLFCHKPDATGAFFQPVRFEQNCRVCHSLQFDPETPELTLPHGQTQFLSAFLNSLGRQYADLARERRGLRSDEEVQGFVTARLQAVQDRFGSRSELEQQVLLGTSTLTPASQVGTLSGPARAVYPGCAYCHEVKAGANNVPRVTPGVIPDRWLTHGGFNHAKHTQVACVSCHAAAASKETADIILPSKSACVTCHSPAGGVKHACSTCHSYHNQPPKPGLSAR